MKKLSGLLVLFCFSFTLGTTTAPNGEATTTHKDKLMFINAIPTNPYDVVGKTGFKNTKKNMQMAGLDPTGMRSVIIAINAAVEKEQKGKQDPFQAVIVYSPIKIELINFKTGILQQNSDCIVGTKGYKKKCGEKDMYFMTEPLRDHIVVKEVEVKNWSNLGQLKMGKNAIDNFMNKLYERSCKEAKLGVDFDAVVMIDDNLVINGLIETKKLTLLKYK